MTGQATTDNGFVRTRLVVGLGNPGGRYVGTRHNVGFEVIESLASRVGARLRRGRFQSQQADVHIAGARVILMKSLTYVNRTGPALRAALQYYHVALPDLLVTCDDIHLPLGRIRLRRSGAAGGHNGLISIIEALETSDFPRLRVGVNEPPPQMDQVAYVLSRFEREELEAIGAAIARAADAVETWISAGIEEAMNRFN